MMGRCTIWPAACPMPTGHPVPLSGTRCPSSLDSGWAWEVEFHTSRYRVTLVGIAQTRRFPPVYALARQIEPAQKLAPTLYTPTRRFDLTPRIPVFRQFTARRLRMEARAWGK